MTISVVTPTCSRPQGMALLERWMARQTLQPDQWVVADGGISAAVLMAQQRHLYKYMPPGVENFLANLERGLEAATGDIIVIMEDDDWYDRTHLATLVDQLTRGPIAGDPQQRYYHLPTTSWRLMQNKGASLCQTGFHRALLPTLLSVIADRRKRVASANPNERRRAIGVDYYFWHAIPRPAWALERTNTVVGIKGLPGQPGLGIGHRPSGAWTRDPDFRQLVSWTSDEDAAIYAQVAQTEAPDVE